MHRNKIATGMCITRGQFPDTTSVTRIEVDSELGKKIGLTSKVFVPSDQFGIGDHFGTLLFRKGNCMYIQDVEVWNKKQGHLNRLLHTLWNLGFTIKVPNPFPLMEKILEKKGFAKIDELNPGFSPPTFDVVMVKEPPPTAHWRLILFHLKHGDEHLV
jgi:hypothetical protein